MTNVRKNSAKLTREDLKIAPESPTMKLSETPAVEPSDQTSKTVRHAPLVYRVEEIAQLLAISNRAAYNLCNRSTTFWCSSWLTSPSSPICPRIAIL